MVSLLGPELWRETFDRLTVLPTVRILRADAVLYKLSRGLWRRDSDGLIAAF